MRDVSTPDLPLAESGGCGDGCGCGGADADMMECGLDPALSQLLADAGLDPVEVEDIAHMAIAEDLDGGVDVTTVATIPEDAVATADFTAREDGVVAGLRVAEAVLSVVCTDEFEVERHAEDGDRITAGQKLLSVTTRTRDLLTAERSALNILCRLSGIATATRAWADALEGTTAKVRDTRKTTPGLRSLEKFAVRMGGGVNHRMSLSDAALVKDNHVVAAAWRRAGLQGRTGVLPRPRRRGRGRHPGPAARGRRGGRRPDPPGQLHARPDPGGRRDRGRPRPPGVLGPTSTLANAREYAATGVDFLAVGALTHSSPILDIGLDLRAAE